MSTTGRGLKKQTGGGTRWVAGRVDAANRRVDPKEYGSPTRKINASAGRQGWLHEVFGIEQARKVISDSIRGPRHWDALCCRILHEAPRWGISLT